MVLPTLCGSPKSRPGGIWPMTVQDCGGFVTWGLEIRANATAAIWEPSATVYGLGWPGVPVESEYCVAPATESTAPRAAAATAPALTTAPIGASAAAAAILTAGARCRRATSTAAGIRARSIQGTRARQRVMAAARLVASAPGAPDT